MTFIKENTPWNKGQKGLQVAWNKGIKTGIVPKTAFKKGKRVSIKTEFKKGQIPWNNSKKLSAEHKRKIGLSNKYKKRSEETKQKLSEAHKGIKHTKKTKAKISIIVKKAWALGKIKVHPNAGFKKGHPKHKNAFVFGKGKNNNNWRGGTSFAPYSVDWTETLRRSIRERDKYTCKICGKEQGDITFDVHHIDYDKKNCDPDNLITLCKSCHSKTNNNRKKWINYFKEN